MVDAQNGDLPCHSQTFRCVQSGHQVRVHPRPSCDRDKVRALSQCLRFVGSAADLDCVCPSCGFGGPFGQALECPADEECKGLLVGFECYKRVNTLECAIV